ncbi:MAG: hypothetical protein UC703_03915 [Bacilli bacterium]|nr:hypothetical protein [Bacilli bacterium]
MNDKKQAENIVPSVENVTTPPEKDLISSEDVLAVVSGDQVALVEQMERAREAALSQKSNAQEIAAEKAKKKLEEEEKKKKAIMDEVKRRKEEALKREKLAKEEAERKKAEAEAERQRQLAEKKRLEEEAKAKAEQERLELERKKQEKEAAIKAKEDAKKAKIQARIDAKKAKQEAKEAAKRAKIEARENAKKAKEDAKKARIEAKKAKAQARLDAKKKKNESKESSTVVPQQKVVQPVSPAPIPQPKVVASQQKSAVPSQAVTTNSSSTTQNKKSTVADNTKSNPDKKTKKESNLKYYMTFIFFALLIWMVAFLPEISSFVSNYMASKQQEGVPAITTGTLTCTMNTNDDKYDYYYEADFNFKDSKMYRLTFSATTKGDQNLDAIELSGMKSSCDLLQQQTANLEGVEVSCSLSNGVYENVQKLDYEDLKSDLVTTAYLEAGGTYPNYEYGQDINEIEKEMKASNYTCERHS